MDPVCSEVTENVEVDRLSNLSDDLIHKILSFISIKHAVQTSALSSRWRYIWTSMPYLNFSTKDFRNLPRFSKFVKHLLSGRDNQREVFSVNFTFRGKVTQEFVQRIMDYAFSHNVQQLNITCLPGNVYCLAEFPHALFTSQSLKHFTFTGCVQTYHITPAPTWALLTLTTLNLSFYDAKCAGLFSNCANLKNLTLKNCTFLNSFTMPNSFNSFSVHHPRLFSLTLERGSMCVDVVTPQLKNLTIKHWRGINMISAPNLSSLHYTDSTYSYKDNDVGPLQIPTELCHMEKVDIIITSDHDDEAYTHKIVRLLQQLHCVKFLTLSLELVKFFSSLVDLISHQPSPFVNLKSLKIYPGYVSSLEQTQQKVTMSTEVKNYLLGGSPGATFTMVSHEEIKVVKNVTSAQYLMRELQDKLKENIEINMSHTEQDMVSHVATVEHKVWMLQRIDGLLAKVPTSHWAKDKLHARFNHLGVEVKTIMKHVKAQLDIQCDNKFHEPAKSSS